MKAILLKATNLMVGHRAQNCIQKLLMMKHVVVGFVWLIIVYNNKYIVVMMITFIMINDPLRVHYECINLTPIVVLWLSHVNACLNS